MSDGRCNKSWHGVPCGSPKDHIEENQKYDPSPSREALESERDYWKNATLVNEKEIDRLKAEMEEALEAQREDINRRNSSFVLISEDRDLWKSKAEKLAEALRFVGSHAWAGGKSWVDEPHVKAALAEFGEGK